MATSKETQRIEEITAAMREHGPLTAVRLVELTGWGISMVRTQLSKSVDVFERVSEPVAAVGGWIPATWYLRDAACEMGEDEFERRADEMSRSFSWWPTLDHSIDRIVGAMVRGSVNEMRGV
ncbi:hypothetical protein [Paraburkholderia atlantica]|uniref:hypothetical protein n=1 Tax=Paraburkholderia atlantica TaxID=2654982 RepID=UPI00161192D7|nr:hypothetical protein [Paraburkholderia atlantica]MBB5508128.1 hypothetical protein [Paraburkholderia atlantica]